MNSLKLYAPGSYCNATPKNVKQAVIAAEQQAGKVISPQHEDAT